MSLSLNLDTVTKALASFAGRDKAARSLCFYLILRAQSSKKKDGLLALAKQLSNARFMMRQFNHPSMLRACREAIVQRGSGADLIEYGCAATVTGVYTVYGVVELLAWLADAKVIAMDSVRLYKWCLYLWIAALISGICRQLRILYRRGLAKSKEDILTLVSLSSDFMAAINSLPPGILWSGKLTPSQSSTFSLIASLIGFYKAF